jgi:hypothetical protein
VTKDEIVAILRIDDLSDVADALEMELFEIKKAVLAKPLLKQTLKSKFLRLQTLIEIAANQNLLQSDSGLGFQYEPIETTEVLKLWEAYMRAKNRWKMIFSQSQIPQQISSLLEEGLKMELYFANQFSRLNWIDEEPVFGVEPDPMPIQNGLKKASEQGWLTFADLEKNKSELQKDLLLALKRLSLLPKYL